MTMGTVVPPENTLRVDYRCAPISEQERESRITAAFNLLEQIGRLTGEDHRGSKAAEMDVTSDREASEFD